VDHVKRWKNYVERKVKWTAHNFPNDNVMESLLEAQTGIIEECGELAHAHLKMHQSIRGTPDQHEAGAKDAIGDLTVYLWSVIALQREDKVDNLFWDAVDEYHRMGGTAWSRIMKLSKAVGDVADSIDKGQGRMLSRLALARIVGHLIGYCHVRGWDYHQIVNDVWTAVEKRDWKRYPGTGLRALPQRTATGRVIPGSPTLPDNPEDRPIG
jgi:NTP pyrophosphatase (non-canonical NTP hydrolase)